jgi:hypothetical protein
MAEGEPFSRPVRVDSIPRDGLEQTIEASQSERAALAKRMGLPAIERLAADFAIHRVGGGIIEVRGEVRARLTQTCVVSLEPFDISLEEPIEVRFAAPAEAPRPRARSIEAPEADWPEPGDADPPDPIVDGRIDLGALAAEFLSLGLDPYPRKPGAEFPQGDDAPPEKPDDRS